MNLTRLSSFRFVDFPPRFRDQFSALDFVHDVQLQCPNHVRCVLDVPRFLEALKRNGLRVVRPVETAYHDKRRVRVPLKFLQLTNRLIDTELGRLAPRRHDLQIVQTDHGGFRLVGTQRLEQF